MMLKILKKPKSLESKNDFGFYENIPDILSSYRAGEYKKCIKLIRKVEDINKIYLFKNKDDIIEASTILNYVLNYNILTLSSQKLEEKIRKKVLKEIFSKNPDIDLSCTYMDSKNKKNYYVNNYLALIDGGAESINEDEEEKRIDLIKIFIKYSNIDINKKIIFEAKTDTIQEHKQKINMFKWALLNNQPKIALFLLKNGANIEESSFYCGNFYFSENKQKGDKNYFYSNDYDDKEKWESINNEKFSTLNLALTQQMKPEIIHALIEAGIPVDSYCLKNLEPYKQFDDVYKKINDILIKEQKEVLNNKINSSIGEDVEELSMESKTSHKTKNKFL